MQLLKIIFIALLIYFVFRFVARLLFPALLRYFVRKSAQPGHRKQKEKKEGEVSVETGPHQRKVPDDLGEYVDYEEIEEKENKNRNDE